MTTTVEGLWYDCMIKTIMGFYKLDNLPTDFYKELHWVDQQVSDHRFCEYVNLRLWSYKNENCNILDRVKFIHNTEEEEEEEMKICRKRKESI